MCVRAVDAAGFGNDTCVSNAECTGVNAGKVCDKANFAQRCSCKGGVDTCEVVGQCKDFCASTKAERDRVNAAVPKCNSVLDNCGPGGSREIYLFVQVQLKLPDG